MKKVYSKPDIAYESFSLSSSIARTCDVKTDTKGNGECGLEWADYTVFVEGVGGCWRKTIDGSSDYNGICYHVPVATNDLFNS